MALNERGIIGQYDGMNAGVIQPDVYGIAMGVFLNRTPVTARLPKVPIGTSSFYVTSDNNRPRSTTFTADQDSSQTTLAVTDGSIFMEGDVIEIASEQMLVTAISTNTLTVTRAYGGTTGAAHTFSGATIYLITNTRTGGEVDVNGVARIPTAVLQTCQTVQHPYGVAGALDADTNYVNGIGSALTENRTRAMRETMDDFEQAVYYGRGVTVGSTTARPQMKGFRTLCVTNNILVTPTNYNAYKVTDFVRDTIQKVADGGGDPRLLFLSTDFLGAFVLWGAPAQRIPAGATLLGTPIDTYESPFVNGASIIPCPLLKPGSAICCSPDEVRIRLKRKMFDKPRGSRGDAEEGDIIMEGALELDNEAHHAFVQGITVFST